MQRTFQATGLALAGLLAATAPGLADVSVQAYGPGQYFNELRYWASSVLAPQAGNDYGPENLFDGSDRTAWCEGVPGTGAGQSVTLSFGGEAMPNWLVLKNGYAKNADVFYKNARPRTVEVRTSTGSSYRTQLADTTAWQELSLPNEWIDWVSITIIDVYPGSKWSDTCITELYANFEG